MNDLLIAKLFDTVETIAKAYIVYKTTGIRQQAEIQQQQQAMDGLGFLSDLFGRFLNQQHGDNVLQYLMQFLEKLPKQPQPEAKPEPKEHTIAPESLQAPNRQP